MARSGLSGATWRRWGRKLAPAALCIAGVLYPLAGIVLGIILRVRKAERQLVAAPLLGAALSLALYTVNFFVAVALQG